MMTVGKKQYPMSGQTRMELNMTAIEGQIGSELMNGVNRHSSTIRQPAYTDNSATVVSTRWILETADR